MPDRFVELVRSSACSPPTKLSFSREKWTGAFESVSTPSESDRRLFESGLWLEPKLSALRSIIDDLPVQPREPDAFIVSVVGLTNQQWQAGSRQMNRPADRNAPFSVLELADRKARVPWKGATPIVDTLASTIDALRYPVARALRGAVPGRDAASPDPLKAMVDLVNLGNLYLRLEAISHEMVWNGEFVTEREKVDFVVPTSADLLKDKCAAYYRGLNRQHELIERATEYWNYHLPAAVKATLASVPKVTAIERSGRKKRIYFRAHTLDRPPMAFAYRFIAQDTYFESLVGLPLPKASGLTLIEVLAAWQAIAGLAHYLEDQQSTSGLITYARLPEFAPRFSRECLHDFLVRAAPLPPAKADAAIELLSFPGSMGSDLWLYPLVPLSDGRVVVVNAAGHSPNLLRNIEHWMQVGGLDLGKRGLPFEQQVRDTVIDVAATGRLARTAGALRDSIDFQAGGRSEQIDLVFWIGDVVAIGEAKCSVDPIEPLERYNVSKTLAEKAAQVTRKAAHVAAHLADFGSQVGMPTVPREVVPLVVTNLLFGSGTSIDGVPVVDLPAIVAYLATGEFQVGVQLGPSRGTSGRRVEFYSSEAEAPGRLMEYLRSLPQYQLYRRFLKDAPKAFPALSPSVTGFYELDYEFDYPAFVADFIER